MGNKFKFDQRLTANYFAPLCGLCVHREEPDEKKCAKCLSEVASIIWVESIEVSLEDLAE
jgi:hypothetical protein